MGVVQGCGACTVRIEAVSSPVLTFVFESRFNFCFETENRLDGSHGKPCRSLNNQQGNAIQSRVLSQIVAMANSRTDDDESKLKSRSSSSRSAMRFTRKALKMLHCTQYHPTITSTNNK
jgi:hypothetical protein